eukprot:204676_1
MSRSQYNYECDNPKTCDYVDLTLYPSGIGTIHCNALDEAKYSYPWVTNYCYYDRDLQLYKMYTCTDTMMSYFVYSDALCSGDPLYQSQNVDECARDHDAVIDEYMAIQTCTTPMNHVADKCGYVQMTKNYRIEPLDICSESDTYSYMWTCHSSKPFQYYWRDNHCGSKNFHQRLSFNPAMFVFIILSSVQLLVRFTNGCGFIESNGEYLPLNACVNNYNYHVSFYVSCYGNQAYQIRYKTLHCAGIVYDNLTMSRSQYNYECDNPKTCDYVDLTLYPSGIGTIHCNALDEAKYSYPWVTNYCYYDRDLQLYKMYTCTDTMMSYFVYSDALCSGDPLYQSQNVDECARDHDAVIDEYMAIQTCTTPMNHVADKCGYVQMTKNYRIEPLDICVETNTFSYIWTCHSSMPFIYYWEDNHCGDLSTMDGNHSVIPIAYSCATNACNQSLVTTYQTTNCTVRTNVASNVTSSTTVPYIIDTCMNWFDVNNVMVSEQYFCVEEDDQTSFYGVRYDKPNCDASEGSHVFVNYTDQCVEDGDEQYLIQCNNVVPRTTQIPNLTTVQSTTSSINITTAIPTSTTYAPSPVPTFKNERVLYVTSTGNGSCLIDWTCGTLYDAIRAASDLIGYENISKVEIIVQGQNAEMQKVGVNPCIPELFDRYSVLFSEITVTFDTDHIHEMKDWYNTDLCESYHSSGFFSQRQGGSLPFSLIINNMIFDSYIFEGRSNQPFYIINVHQFTCNYCVFRNITIRSNHYTLDKLYKYTDSSHYPTLISSAVIDLHQCEFEDIAYEIFANGIDVYRYSFIQVRLVPTQHYGTTFSLTMSNHTVVANITHLYRFIDVYMTDGYIVVSDVTFTNITVFDALISHAGEISTITNVRITDTNVYHLALGSIFRVHENTKSFIKIHNMNISTSQTIQHNLNTKQSYGISTLDDYYALFVFESKLDIISVEHVNVKYIYGHYLADNCKSDPIFDWIFAWQMMERDIGKKLDFVHTTMQCNVPIEFVHSVADVDIHHLTVRNDITDTLVEAFKSFIVDEVHQYRGRNKDTVYVHLVFDLEEFTAFIYNDGGALNVEYLTVYGLGAHANIIHNNEGDLSINQLVAVPETHCTLIPCEYDRDSLQIETWIRFGGDASISNCNDMTVTVRNSYIHGSESAAIVVTAGYAHLHNVTIQMAAFGIHAYTDCMYLEIIECNMMDIGAYYASSSQFLRAHSDLRMPFALASSELIITDSIFSFVGPYQFVMFGTADYFDASYFVDAGTVLGSGRRKITLINNIFEINDQNVVTPYLSNHSVQYLFDIDLFSTVTTNITVDSSDASKHFIVNGTMHLESGMDVMMIDNEFKVNPNNLYVSQSLLMDYNLPWIYASNADDGTNSICMSGNEFTGFAIYANHANITSCVKTQLLDYFSTEDCDSYGTFGTVASSAYLLLHRQPNVFNINDDGVLSILMAEHDSYIALDNIVINIFDTADNITSILDIFEGNYLLVDTIINTTTEYDIKANENCDIPCYSTVSDNADAIPVFHVMCGDDMSDAAIDTVSIHEIYDVYQQSHWSPHLIHIDAHNNGSYVPGNTLLFDYSITDVYGNHIHAVNQKLVVNFQSVDSSELYLSFKLVIDDGFCAECVNGISFPALTIDMADEVYSFNGVVTNNNVRIKHSVNVTVDRCPSGYGATGTNQCDVCSIGYFNLMSTNDSCYYCDDNALDGITCPGSNHIIMDHNYWVSAYQYNDAVDDIFASTYVVSSKCPSSYCCQLSQGCDLLSNASSLCAPNRDSKTYLCGSCVDGFSEAVGTTKCMECHRGYPLLLLIPITYGLAWAMFILVTKR